MSYKKNNKSELQNHTSLFIRALFFALFLALPVSAAQAPNSPQKPSSGTQENDKSNPLFSIYTGQKTGTYYTFGRDIADVARKSGIEVDVKSSGGSIDNIKYVNNSDASKNISNIGIVQSDVLGFLGRSKNPDSIRMANNLRLVFPFYNEEVHVLARNGIKTFADLQGKKVAIGEDGSGNMLTSVNLFSIMNVVPAESQKISPAQGVVSVLKGDIDAVIFVGGKPVRLFKNLEDLTLPENQKYGAMLDKVHFIPMDSAKMLEEYKPAEITNKDYSFVKETVPTISVQAILVSYYSGQDSTVKRCEQIGNLATSLRNALPALKESGHPKWKEVSLDANVSTWKKDSCAWADASKAESKDLLNIIDKK